MKPLEHKNYYEVLEVPTDASADEIKRAYHNALATYDDDSLVTYSLFSDEQRAEILRMIECAFNTLIDAEKRSQYNRKINDTSQAICEKTDGQDRVDADSVNQALNNSKADSLQAWVRTKSADEEIQAMVDKMLDEERICGKDLKNLRTALGVEIREIYETTRISPTVLTHIEEDRFEELPAEFYLRRFLRSYAELLQLEPQPIVDGYFKNMA